MFINNKKLGRFWKNEKNNTTDKIERIIRDYSLALDPCGMCENKDKIKGHSCDVCRSCCYYYASNFKIKGNKK